jgi:glyoxylate reductase
MAPKKPVVLLTSPFIACVIRSELSPYAKIEYALTRAELLKKIGTADALIARYADLIDQAVLERGKNLKVVGNFAVGYDNIDRKICFARAIRVVNTPDVLTRATAELTVTLLFAVARRIREGEKICRSGKFKKSLRADELLGLELKSRHAVLVGEGRIGRETAAIFRALGMSVEFIHRDENADQLVIKLKRAQVLSFHCSLNSSTYHWLNSKRLALLPRDAIVLNTTRGPVVDEKALIQALKMRRIFGAGLDVYEHEPKIPPALRALPNTILLPHVGSATETARTAMARLVVNGVLRVLGAIPGGQDVPNEVKFVP